MLQRPSPCESRAHRNDRPPLSPPRTRHVAAVKEQSNCGSCWAFAATGAIEAAHYIATGTLTDLSESNLVDCDHESNGCIGGWPSSAFRSAISDGGLLPTLAYPYTPTKHLCSFDSSTAAVTLAGFTDINANDECALLQAVCNQPVTVAVNVRREARACVFWARPAERARPRQTLRVQRAARDSAALISCSPAYCWLSSRTGSPAVCTTHPC